MSTEVDVLASHDVGDPAGESRGLLSGRSAGGVELLLLGGFELRVHGVPLPLSYSARRLLALLALRTRSVSRAYAAGLLWAESAEERAAGNMRTALWGLRQQVECAVSTLDGMLALNAHVRVDVHELTILAESLISDPVAVLDSCPNLGLLSHDLLPDWDEEWLPTERERIRQLRLHALESACLALGESGRPHEAIQLGLRAVDAEPLRESANVALVRAYLSEGNQAEAVRHFRGFHELHVRELGLDPTHTFSDIVDGLTAERLARAVLPMGTVTSALIPSARTAEAGRSTQHA